MKQKNIHGLWQDLVILAISIIVAIFLVQSNLVIHILRATDQFGLFASFVGGLFFTSAFTTAPAIVTLAEISQVQNLFTTAFVGAIGAVAGDLIIFSFVRERMSLHLLAALKHSHRGKRMRSLMKMRAFRWFSFVLGGMIIASPLPDELGISLLGFSKMKFSWFIPISFVFNFLGICLIGLVARTI